MINNKLALCDTESKIHILLSTLQTVRHAILPFSLLFHAFSLVVGVMIALIREVSTGTDQIIAPVLFCSHITGTAAIRYSKTFTTAATVPVAQRINANREQRDVGLLLRSSLCCVLSKRDIIIIYSMHT